MRTRLHAPISRWSRFLREFFSGKNIFFSPKQLLWTILVAGEISACKVSFAQTGANKTLSNLTSPTAVNVDLLPNSTNSRNLGSSTLRWKNIHANGSIFLGGVRFLATTTGTGSFNTAVGASVLNSNTDGESNTGTGYRALFSNTQGWSNTATGYQALYNSNADYNTAIGASALFSNTSGYDNTAIGVFALTSNTTGSLNTATGGSALSDNTTGHSNSALGWASLTYNTTGYSNTASGYAALFYNSTGSENTAFGNFALSGNTTSWGNTAIGVRAGNSYANGYYNTYLGSDADANGAQYYNSVAIGNISTVTASLQIRVGNSLMSSIGGYQNWTNLSDGRYKKNVKEEVKGLEFILRLRPVTYNLDVTGICNHLNESRGREMNEQTKDAIAAKEKVIFSGFIAQDVEQAAKETGYDFSGVDAPKNEKDFYGLRYAEFVVPLVKAVQELDEENGKLSEGLLAEKIENAELKAQIAKLNEAVFGSRVNSGSVETKSDVSLFSREIGLGQNIPNPFDNSTLIPFRIPKDCNDASIMITNTTTSEVISVIPISCNENHVSVDAEMLASGTYSYALYVNGKMIDMKQMVITK